MFKVNDSSWNKRSAASKLKGSDVVMNIFGEGSMLPVFLAVLAALFTFTEYFFKYTSIVEFRFAAPFNRHRFVTIFAIVALLSLVCKGVFTPTELTLRVKHWGDLLGQAIDIPYSPVRLIILMLHDNASVELVEIVRTAAGLAYSISLLSLVIFVLLVRVFKWPSKSGAFNVWIN